MKLKAPVKFTKGVRPVCVPELGWDIPPGTQCYATGWGETRGMICSKLFSYVLYLSLNFISSYITHIFNFCSHTSSFLTAKTNKKLCSGKLKSPVKLLSLFDKFVYLN